MKKVILSLFVFLSISLSIGMVKVLGATNVYSGTKYYETGILWWHKTWKADYYLCDTSYYTIATLKYIGNSYYWDGGVYYPTATISMEVGVVVSETKSWELSESLGLEIPIYPIKIVPQMGIAYSNSLTVTQSISNMYSVTLQNGYSPAGYYTFEARMNMDKYKVLTYETTSGTAVYADTGYTFIYKSENPYYYCAYTDHSVN